MAALMNTKISKTFELSKEGRTASIAVSDNGKDRERMDVSLTTNWLPFQMVINANSKESAIKYFDESTGLSIAEDVRKTLGRRLGHGAAGTIHLFPLN